MTNLQVICFGEILWDIFPEYKVIGGAPLNVALRLASLQVNVGIVSCIGNDESGDTAARYINSEGVVTDFVARHKELKTGEVWVVLDKKGSASYTISDPVSWDAIPPAPHIVEAVGKTPYFIFGSLAFRNEFNRNTMKVLLPKANTKIFDVNLRAPHYNLSIVHELMQHADFIKLNDEELVEVCDGLGCEMNGLEERIRWLQQVTQTETICVTQGDKGATLLCEGSLFYHPGFKVKVEDTVGAGDSFLAALVNTLLIEQKSPENALATACATGALVASKSGANCSVSDEEISALLMA
ncbi:MAG: carbohydrate kinase [Aureisphaera sp.]